MNDDAGIVTGQGKLTWLQAATRPDVVKRSLKVALIVGTILALINQGNVLLSGVFAPELIWKIPMTYCVPFCVSTYASVQAILAAQ
jgi:hypothetical protein